MTPALLRRITALGFEPGDMNPEAWIVRYAETITSELDNLRSCANDLKVERRRLRQMLDVIDSIGDCSCGGRIVPRSVDWAMCTSCFDESFPISDWAAGRVSASEQSHE